MKILMVTNVFTPQIGGVTRSIQQFCEEYRRQQHDVLVVAPEYEQTPVDETGVIRVPAIPNFYQNSYSLPIPLFSGLLSRAREFAPDIVHAHHPFLLGDTAQVIAADRNVPLVYTHHTRYSKYIEAKTNWSPSVEEGVVELIVGFCELCDGIVAPSDGMKELLNERGITGRMEVIPTGVVLENFQGLDRRALRQRLSLPDDAFIIGHVGRLAPEKNTAFLTQAVAKFLQSHKQCVFVVGGDGPDRKGMEQILEQAGVSDRSHFLGFCEGKQLAETYAGMDLFAFASHTETQGMVLAEAMAAGVPVIGVDATGIRDLVVDNVNGRLIPNDDQPAFITALEAGLDHSVRSNWQQAALQTAEQVSQRRCGTRMLAFYDDLIAETAGRDRSEWERLHMRWQAAWQQWCVRARALATTAKLKMEELTGPGE